jgi:hypothetical protein
MGKSVSSECKEVPGMLFSAAFIVLGVFLVTAPFDLSMHRFISRGAKPTKVYLFAAVFLGVLFLWVGVSTLLRGGLDPNG